MGADEAEAVAVLDLVCGHSGGQARFAGAAHADKIDVPAAVIGRYVNLPRGQADGVSNVHASGVLREKGRGPIRPMIGGSGLAVYRPPSALDTRDATTLPRCP